MNETIVYRVQDRFGRGPYRCDDMNVAPNVDWLRHPAPREDFEVFNCREDGWYSAFIELIRPYKFGFPTLQAAFNWFHEDELQEMSQLGFHLVEIKAESVVVSDSGRQCIFIPLDKFYANM
jgi:hypothetical protein